LICKGVKLFFFDHILFGSERGTSVFGGFKKLKLKVTKRRFIQHCNLKKPIVLLPPDEFPSFTSRGAITPSGARALC
jgi:hypothetical protein